MKGVELFGSGRSDVAQDCTCTGEMSGRLGDRSSWELRNKSRASERLSEGDSSTNGEFDEVGRDV
jgi:hypothetical protein